MPQYIVLLGPPGAGKGTQAKNISGLLGIEHISSGDIFRDNLKRQTELGILAQSFMKRGELVPDDITIEMIRERLSRKDCKTGALLDGFPRTPAQAGALAKILEEMSGAVSCVPYIAVPAEELVKRLSGRWTCQVCGHIYHQQFNPPKLDGLCDQDGSELYQREDDRSETVKNRIQVYMDQTEPLISYYQEKDLLVKVDGTQSIEEVSAEILKAIRGKV
ncbi:MAG: adenylate kinase [Anaerolineaceae bacterium]|jgi:adenylate kinase|nr:adenylate kinase [Anaerolineaceae bacterium]